MPRLRIHAVPLALCLAVVTSLPAPALAGWYTDVVEGGPNLGWLPVVTIDGAGEPAVAYVDFFRRVHVARHPRAVWSPERVAVPGLVSALDLVTDSAGQPVVACISLRTPGSLDYVVGVVRWNAASWSYELVDEDVNANYLSAASDPAGNPALSYPGFSTSRLRFAHFSAGSWTIEEPDPLSWRSLASSLAYDPAGNPAIAYTSDVGGSPAAVLTRWNGTAWTRSVVAPPGAGHGPGTSYSLAFDPAGNPAVACFTQDFNLNTRELWVARWDGTAWAFEVVDPQLIDPVEPRIDLGFDASGSAVVSYGQFGAKLARRTSGGWVLETVAADAREVAMAMTPGGRPVVAFATRTPEDVQISVDPGDALVLRGVVATLTPGWQASALPLSTANDDETAQFPLTAATPGTSPDAAPPLAALLLYRVQWSGGGAPANTLQLIRRAPGITLTY